MVPLTSSRTALVTGGAGFIGSHLCEHLLMTGWRVRVLDDLSTGTPANLQDEVELVVGDVRDPELCDRVCSQVDTVFHLAAQVTIRHSSTTFYRDADVNLMGTLTMLQAAGAARVRRFVLASSMAVYADSPDHTPVSEEHALKPLSPYGISKATAESYVLMLGPQLGLEPVVLRFFNTYGTRQGYTPYVGVITIFITNIVRGEPCVVFGDGEQCRDFVHVADIVQACVLAARHRDAVGNVFNVGTGRGTTVNQLFSTIKELMGAGHRVVGPLQGMELQHSVADIGRLRGLGFIPEGRLENRLGEVITGIRAAR